MSTEQAAPNPHVLVEVTQNLALRVAAGAGTGRVVPLDSSPVSIGRETTNTLVLADPKVSRHHVRIELVDGVWVAMDLRSKNGTRLNGVEIYMAGLAPGDRIYVGDTVLQVETGRPPALG